jgi:Protein of unknown function (DUF2490)
LTCPNLELDSTVSFMQKSIFTANIKKGITRSICLVLLISIGTSQDSQAQLGTKTQEVWPSMDVYYRINPKYRVYGTIGGTKIEESSYTDGAIGIFIDHFTYPLTNIFRPNHAEGLPERFLWLRAGYQYTATPPSSEDPFKESMIVTEANYRFNLPYNILLTTRNRVDWRFNSGDFNARYRPKLVLDKDLHTEYLTFTATGYVEYFVNFGNSAVNRLRMQLGVEIKVFKHINYEVFWNHQVANPPEIQKVDAFGMCLKIYINHPEVKSYIENKKKKSKEKKEKKDKKKNEGN